MSYEILLVLLLVLLMQADHLALGQTICGSNGNYSSNSAYSANLNTTLSSLYTNIDNDGFYNASIGQGADTVNALALCRGDVQLNECRDCVQKAGSNLVDSCPVQKQAFGWEENCTLRYSNATVYASLATAPAYYVISPQNVTSPDRFREALRVLLDDLRGRATGGSSARKVAAGYTTGPDYQTIFSMVQCTPDLTSEDCNSCLDGAISEIPLCCEGKRGARVLRPSCYVRFESTPFYNETMLQELESVPLPPPPLTQPTPSGNHTVFLLSKIRAFDAEFFIFFLENVITHYTTTTSVTLSLNLSTFTNFSIKTHVIPSCS